MTQPMQYQGDHGVTTLPSGGRIVKSSALTSATGTLEELMAHLGACRAIGGEHYNLDDRLEQIQLQLYRIDAALANPKRCVPTPEWMEREIAELFFCLPDHTGRIIPSGSQLSTQIMIARAVARRLERETVPLTEGPFFVPVSVLAWMNRCGDLLYVMARYANAMAEYPEEICPR